MSPKTIPEGAISQQVAFYDREWSRPAERAFVNALLDQIFRGKYISGGHPKRAIQAAMGVVNRIFGTSFTEEQCLTRFNMLKERYMIFKWIIGLPDVTHHPFTNEVTCTDETWRVITREHPLAYAYMITGEAEYEALCTIFQAHEEETWPTTCGNPQQKHRLEEGDFMSTTPNNDIQMCDGSGTGNQRTYAVKSILDRFKRDDGSSSGSAGN